MATIAKQGVRLDSVLNRLIRSNGVVMTWRDRVAMMSQNPEKSITDGNIAWSRRRFNRMDGREQEAYEDRLNARRVYILDGILVPKMIFDAMPGRLVSDIDRPEVAEQAAGA